MRDFKAYAFSLLRVRSRSEFELRTRLKEKGASREEIEEIIGLLKLYGLLDDKEFACEFARSKARNHWSWLKIEMTLLHDFRVKKEHVEVARGCYDEDEVLNYYIKRFKKTKKDPEYIKRHLLQKGFDWDFVNRILKSL